MYELIKIENTPLGPSLRDTTIGSETVPTVNARELHENLEISTRYNDWIKNRIDKYGFRENRDFLCLTENLVTQTSSGKQGVSSKFTHYIFLDMAKELCMVENSEKGRSARQYFIECEKKLHRVISPKQHCFLDIIEAEDDIDRLFAIRKLDKTVIKPLEQFKEEALPKVSLSSFRASSPRGVSYYDNVLNSPDLVTITQIAKDYGMTAVKLNKLLESLNIQYKQSGQWLLYHNYAKEGYTQSSTYLTELGTTKLNTKWTQKGRLFIYEKLKSEGILPICESPEGGMK